MKKKSKILLAIIFFAGLSLSSLFAKTIRFAEFAPARGLRAEALKNFAEQLELRSEGELKIQFFWGGSLLKTRSILKGVGDRVADMGSVVGFLTPKQLSLYTIGDLPLQNSDEWVGMKAMHDLANLPLLQKEFRAANVVYLSNYTTGPIQLICRKKVASITELKRKKIRASGAYAKIFAELGANIQKLSQPNVYQALQTGLVDCNQNYYYAIEAYKQYEVASHLVELDWGQNMSFGIVVNHNFFSELAPKHQKLLKKLGADFIDDFAKAMIAEKKKIKSALQKGIDGYQLEIITPSKEQKNILQEKGQKQVGEWVQKNQPHGEELLAEYQKLIKKYQKIKKK
jgi:TRAP-type C4-dicarboxylate transport system substrate-binding protein